MIMAKRAILVRRFRRFLKVGRQRVNINSSFVRHGTVNLRRMPDLNHAHGEIQNERRRCSFHIVLEAAPRKPGKRMLVNGHSPSWQRCIAIESAMMFNSDHSRRKMFNSICTGVVLQHLSLSQLPCGKWLASHRRVDGIEDGQPTDICYATYGDRITQILDLGLRVGERRPLGKIRAVRIA